MKAVKRQARALNLLIKEEEESTKPNTEDLRSGDQNKGRKSYISLIQGQRLKLALTLKEKGDNECPLDISTLKFE